MIKPALVLPLHDTDGLIFSHLAEVTPSLKEIFSRTFISITPPTAAEQPERVARLQGDPFFQLNFNAPDTLPGHHFVAAYRNAVANSRPAQMLHLCTVDRVIYALQSHHRAQFLADIQTTSAQTKPVLFQRSSLAWDTHPQNYRALETIGSQVGQLLFDKQLDFFWCHLVIQTQQLGHILPQVKAVDFSMLAEIILAIKDDLQTQDVDWLAWEDPYIFSQDAFAFKQDREASQQETRKRLAYLIPVLQLLLETTA